VRKRSDSAAGDDEEERPAVEKRGNSAESIANEAVKAARLGIGGGEFGVGECAEEREHAADDPDKERGADGAVELPQNQSRREEDARADDGADEEEEQVAGAECAREL
jgi:hypothetical protein